MSEIIMETSEFISLLIWVISGFYLFIHAIAELPINIYLLFILFIFLSALLYYIWYQYGSTKKNNNNKS